MMVLRPSDSVAQALISVHEMWGADDIASEGGAQGLVAEADAEYRQLAGEMAEYVNADASFSRGTGAGRDENSVRMKRVDLLNR
jgi:hypothetical protein